MYIDDLFKFIKELADNPFDELYSRILWQETQKDKPQHGVRYVFAIDLPVKTKCGFTCYGLVIALLGLNYQLLPIGSDDQLVNFSQAQFQIQTRIENHRQQLIGAKDTSFYVYVFELQGLIDHGFVILQYFDASKNEVYYHLLQSFIPYYSLAEFLEFVDSGKMVGKFTHEGFLNFLKKLTPFFEGKEVTQDLVDFCIQFFGCERSRISYANYSSCEVKYQKSTLEEIIQFRKKFNQSKNVFPEIIPIKYESGNQFNLYREFYEKEQSKSKGEIVGCCFMNHTGIMQNQPFSHDSVLMFIDLISKIQQLPLKEESRNNDISKEPDISLLPEKELTLEEIYPDDDISSFSVTLQEVLLQHIPMLQYLKSYITVDDLKRVINIEVLKVFLNNIYLPLHEILKSGITFKEFMKINNPKKIEYILRNFHRVLSAIDNNEMSFIEIVDFSGDDDHLQLALKFRLNLKQMEQLKNSGVFKIYYKYALNIRSILDKKIIKFDDILKIKDLEKFEALISYHSLLEFLNHEKLSFENIFQLPIDCIKLILDHRYDGKFNQNRIITILSALQIELSEIKIDENLLIVIIENYFLLKEFGGNAKELLQCQAKEAQLFFQNYFSISRLLELIQNLSLLDIVKCSSEVFRRLTDDSFGIFNLCQIAEIMKPMSLPMLLQHLSSCSTQQLDIFLPKSAKASMRLFSHENELWPQLQYLIEQIKVSPVILLKCKDTIKLKLILENVYSISDITVSAISFSKLYEMQIDHLKKVFRLLEKNGSSMIDGFLDDTNTTLDNWLSLEDRRFKLLFLSESMFLFRLSSWFKFQYILSFDDFSLKTNDLSDEELITLLNEPSMNVVREKLRPRSQMSCCIV